MEKVNKRRFSLKGNFGQLVELLPQVYKNRRQVQLLEADERRSHVQVVSESQTMQLYDLFFIDFQCRCL